MKFIATVRKGSDLDILWKNEHKKQGEIGPNKFKLFKSLFVCKQIQDLKALLELEEDIILMAWTSKSV